MQNILINMCEKFHCDRLRNDRALGNWKSNNNNNTNSKKKNNKNIGVQAESTLGQDIFARKYMY